MENARFCKAVEPSDASQSLVDLPELVSELDSFLVSVLIAAKQLRAAMEEFVERSITESFRQHANRYSDVRRNLNQSHENLKTLIYEPGPKDKFALEGWLRSINAIDIEEMVKRRFRRPLLGDVLAKQAKFSLQAVFHQMGGVLEDLEKDPGRSDFDTLTLLIGEKMSEIYSKINGARVEQRPPPVQPMPGRVVNPRPVFKPSRPVTVLVGADEHEPEHEHEPEQVHENGEDLEHEQEHEYEHENGEEPEHQRQPDPVALPVPRPSTPPVSSSGKAKTSRKRQATNPKSATTGALKSKKRHPENPKPSRDEANPEEAATTMARLLVKDPSIIVNHGHGHGNNSDGPGHDSDDSRPKKARTSSSSSSRKHTHSPPQGNPIEQRTTA